MGRTDRRRAVRADDGVADDFAALGVSVPEDLREPPEDQETDVWAVNWPSVIAFLACATAWRWLDTKAGRVRVGLDYAGVDVVLRHRRPGDPDRVFADIQDMERAALAAFGENA